MSMTITAVVKTFWPVIVVAGGAIYGYGQLRTSVNALEEARTTSVADHDKITQISTAQALAKEQLDRVENKLDVLLYRVPPAAPDNDRHR